MKIQRKVIIVFVISLVASILAGVFIFFTVTQTQENISKLKIISEVRTEISNRANLLDEYLLYQGERSQTQWVLASQRIDGLLEEAKKILNRSDESALLVLVQENNNVIKQVGTELFTSFSTQSDTTVFSRELETRLVARSLISNSEMAKDASQLGTIVGEEISVTQQRLGIGVGLLVALLFIIVLINLTWIRVIIKKLEESRKMIDAANQQLRASEQQLKAGNQQLRAANQQLIASEKQLQDKNLELERFNKITVGRELKMIELKEEIKTLKKEHGK